MPNEDQDDLFNCRSMRSVVRTVIDAAGGPLNGPDLVRAVRLEMTPDEYAKWEHGKFYADVMDKVHGKRANPMDVAYVVDGMAIQMKFMDVATARQALLGVAKLGTRAFRRVRFQAEAYNRDRGEVLLDADDIIMEAELSTE